MRFNETAELISVERVSDGMGGYIEDEVVVTSFNVAMYQLAQELVVSEYGFDSTTDARLFTRHSGLKRGDTLRVDGVTYKVHRIISYGHISSMVVRKNG